MGVTRDVDEWQSFVHDGIKRVRQQTWDTNAGHIHNYNGVDRGVDEATTRTYYLKLAQKEPMKAGALRTIIADG
eukprot:2296970-Heterocapsa_arctica.AAC.2